jgi:hypothetical protein
VKRSPNQRRILIARGVILECPRCGNRIKTALPTVSAVCSKRHAATPMRPTQPA